LEQLLPGNAISWRVTNIFYVRLASLFFHEFLFADEIPCDSRSRAWGGAFRQIGMPASDRR
jgi:hypothetical protein